MPTVRENIDRALASSYALTGTPGPAHMGHLRSLLTTFHQALLALLEGDTPDPEPAEAAEASSEAVEGDQGGVAAQAPSGDAGGASETPSASEPTPPAEPATDPLA